MSGMAHVTPNGAAMFDRMKSMTEGEREQYVTGWAEQIKHYGRDERAQLRARLAEVEAERDAATRDCYGWIAELKKAHAERDNLAAANARLRQRAEKAELDCESRDMWAADTCRALVLTPEGDDGAFATIAKYVLGADVESLGSANALLRLELARLRQGNADAADLLQAKDAAIDDLGAQVEHMRSVVEAAEALIDWYRTMAGAPLHPRLDDFHPLTPTAAAVDAYRAAQKGSLDRPESTESQDLHPGDAGSTSDRPEAHRPAEGVKVCGYWPADAPYAHHLRCTQPTGHGGPHVLG